MQALGQRGFTDAEVLDALRGRHGSRELSFRYSLLDADNEYLRELSNVEACSISQASFADIIRTARFTVLDDGSINFLSNRIQPWVRLAMPGLTPGEPATYAEVLQAVTGGPLLRYPLDEPIPDYATALAPFTPLLWYRLDDPALSNVAENSGSAGAPAAGVVSAPATMPGAPGAPGLASSRAFAFASAANDRITAVDASLSGKAALTVSAWVKANATGDGVIVSFPTAASGGSVRVELMFIATGGVSAAANCIRASVRVGASTVASETLAGTQSTATMHLAMTWVSGEAPKIYVNGVLAAVTSNAPLAGTVTAHTHVIVGGRGGTGGAALSWNGVLDEVFADDSAYTADQILTLYRAGAGLVLADNVGSTGSAQDGIPVGAGMPGKFGLVVGGSSWDFNPANNNHVRIPGGGTVLDNLDRITYSFWFRADAAGVNDFLIDNTNNAGGNDGISIWKSTNNRLIIRMQLTTGFISVNSPNQSLGADTTYHVVVTWQSGLPMRVWLNGEEQTLTVQVNSQPLDSIGLINMTNADLYLGRWFFDNTLNSANLLDGMMDDVVVAQAYVNDEQVAALYNAGIQSGKYAGDNYVEWPQGVFLVTSPERVSDEADVVRRVVEAYDQNQVLADDLVTTRFTATQGDLYTTVISGILGTMAKTITPSTLQVPVDTEWPPGTSKLTIINDLCNAINYDRLFFDEYGSAVVRPYVAPADRASEHTYRDDGTSVTLPQVAQLLDLFQVPNRWVLVVSDPDRGELRSERTNDDPNSLTSTISRGRTIVDFRTEEDAPDQATLDAKTERLALEASQIFETVQFETLLMPIHSHNDVYTFAYGNLAIDGKYAETGWEMQLEAGSTMKHSIRRTVNVNLTGV